MTNWTDQNKILARHWLCALPAVQTYVAAFVVNPADVDDILQSVAMTVVDKFGEYDSSRPFVNWAIGIARNLVLDRRRLYARSRLIFSEQAMKVVEQAAIEVGCEYDQRAVALRQCLSEISEESQQLIRMRYEQNVSVQVIADQLGRRANTVSMSLTRIRRALRDCVQGRLNRGDV
jgi:RNA polymerase sigma-70 factor (ECF subfamily)